jgi:hypothetical protein
MNQPVKHHYVPVFYLARWTGADGRLCRYHRPYGRTVASHRSPEHTGFEKDLYTMEGVDEPRIIETGFFSQVDNAAAPVLDRMVSGGLAALTGPQRSSWARFIMSLQLRSPYSLSEVRKLSEQTIRENLERSSTAEYLAVKKEGDPASPFDHAVREIPQLIENAAKAFLPGLIDHEFIGDLIVNMRWAVMDLSAARRTLLTCDRPYTTSAGLGYPSCLLSVPLSPTHLFVAANDFSLLQILAAQRADDTVRNSNNLMVRLAVQNVYGVDDSQLAFVEKCLRRSSDPVIPGVISQGQGAC